MPSESKKIRKILEVAAQYSVDATPEEVSEAITTIRTVASAPRSDFPAGLVAGAVVLGIAAIIAGAGTPQGADNPNSSGIVEAQAVQPSVVTIQNYLLRPVKIFVDDRYAGQLDAEQTGTWGISDSPVEISFEVIQLANDNNEPFGDSMIGVWERAYAGATLKINNVIGDSQYFYPIFTNSTWYDCEISINNGYVNENRPGTLRSRTENVIAGYFRFFSNTNVTLFCDDGMTYHWGSQPDDPVTPINFVEAESGLLRLTLNP